jgi:hypothetical protein
VSSNSELEKQVSELRAELATLRKVLDATFRNAGLSNDWWQANAMNRPTTSEQLAKDAATAVKG